MAIMSDIQQLKGPSSRPRSPLRAAYDVIRSSMVTSPTSRRLSPMRRLQTEKGKDAGPVTASITKIKTIEEGNKRVITLQLGRKDFACVTGGGEGKMVSFSNKRCRLVYDPEASGELRVSLTPAGVFQVASSNPSAGTLKVVIEKCKNNDDRMQTFLFQEAKVGSSFTLAYE